MTVHVLEATSTVHVCMNRSVEVELSFKLLFRGRGA